MTVPSTPSAAGPRGIVDPHIHQWDPLTTWRSGSAEARALRLLPRIPRALRVVASQCDREFAGDLGVVLKPYLPADYARDAAGAGVDTVVHIEAEWPHATHRDTVDETRWVTAQAWGSGDAPELGAVVVYADPAWDDVGAVLDEHLDASPLVRGVRAMAAWHRDPGVRDFTGSAHRFADPAFLRGFAAIAERGLSFELWCYDDQLPEALALVREYPETTFVLCHYATPVGLLGPRGRDTGRSPGGLTDRIARWRDAVSALAAEPGVVAKHSGLGMPLLGAEVRTPRSAPFDERFLDAVRPLVTHVHAAFGPRRTMWASNYPMDRPGLGLPASIELLRVLLGPDFDEGALLRHTARRVYRLA